MTITIENVTTTGQRENNEVIRRVSLACEGINRIEEALTSINERMDSAVFWTIGRGGNHIWVSNGNNERLMIITA